MVPQLHTILSQPPGNIVYHLVTLLAIQTALGLGLSQWRRARSRPGAEVPALTLRLLWGATGLLLLRLLLLVILLANRDTGDLQPVLRLPPLESAVDLASAVLLVWIVVPSARHPRLARALVALGLLTTTVLYIFFAAQWPARAVTGLAFSATLQATIWTAVQLGVWGFGAVALLLTRPPDTGLRLGVPAVLLLAHSAQLAERLTMADAGETGWLRLGYLIALPLLALIAYRHNLHHIAGSRALFADADRGWPALAALLQSPTDAAVRLAALPLLHATVPLAWAGIAFADKDAALQLVGRAPADADVSILTLDVADASLLQQTLADGHLRVAKAEGPGARQWHAIAQPTTAGQCGALLIARLEAPSGKAGAILLLAPPGHGWPAADKRLVHALAAVIQSARPIPPPSLETPAPDVNILQNALDEAISEQNRAELALQRERRRTQDLAAALAEVEGDLLSGEVQSVDFQTADIRSLEAEIVALRESLLQAEEAMALVAASEEEISPEWVTQTISRYSAELEASEAQIAELERQVQEQDRVRASAVLLALIQELRTPMTSIAGYSDLLLAEKAGPLGVRQRHFLQRVNANVERMQTLLHQIDHLTGENQQLLLAPPELLNVHEVVETAVAEILAQVREKGLRLETDVPADLPPISANRQVLYEIFSHLLYNACHASRAGGRVAIILRVTPGTPNGQAEPIRFLQLSVIDSGMGIRIEDRPHIFDYRYHAENPLISGLGDTGAALPLARTLVAAHGGRIWVDSERGVGTTIAVLLPITTRRRGVTKPLANG